MLILICLLPLRDLVQQSLPFAIVTLLHFRRYIGLAVVSQTFLFVLLVILRVARVVESLGCGASDDLLLRVPAKDPMYFAPCAHLCIEVRFVLRCLFDRIVRESIAGRASKQPLLIRSAPLKEHCLRACFVERQLDGVVVCGQLTG